MESTHAQHPEEALEEEGNTTWQQESAKDKIKVKILMPTFRDRTIEDFFDAQTTIEDIKTKVIPDFIKEHDLCEVDQIVKIRIFYSGTELDDDSETLADQQQIKTGPTDELTLHSLILIDKNGQLRLELKQAENDSGFCLETCRIF